MGNTFFKYKKFTIHQDKCAMKVCTDTSLFGALIKPNNPDSILDIGTGTGVLSLMIAQKTNGNIIGVEIDKNASEQAIENFQISPWSNKLEVINNDILNFAKESNKKFDLIISNPPFFQDNMLSNVSEKNKARHNTSLSLKELAQSVDKLLFRKGSFWVLLPHHEAMILENYLKEHNITIENKVNVKNYIKDLKISRVVNCYSRNNNVPEEETIAIYNNKKREYTKEFIQLLKPYYLYL